MKKTVWPIGIVLLVLVLTGIFIITDIPAFAADQTRAQEQIETHQISGSHLMTSTELQEYRTRMHNAKTSEEQERIRNEHHERMKERARDLGVILPEPAY